MIIDWSNVSSMKHWEESWKCDGQIIFVERLILPFKHSEGEIKDTKMSSFSSYFQTLIKH